MQFQNEQEKTRVLSLLLALAVTAHILELFIPSPPFLPWLKIGSANAFTMTALYLFGPLAGLQIAILRTIISGFFTGIPATSLLIGGSGGIVAAMVMGALWHYFRGSGLLSLIGVGIAGSFFHTITQLGVVYALFIKNPYIFWQIPLLGPISVATGTVTGLVAQYTCRFLERQTLPQTAYFPATHTSNSSLRPLVKLSILIIGTGALLMTPLPMVLAACSFVFASTLVVQGRMRTLAFSMRFIPLFILTFALNMFSEPGRYVTAIPFITHEGITKSLFLVVRTLAIMLFSMALFSPADCTQLFTTIMRIFPPLSRSMEIALRGTAAFPAVIAILKNFYAKSPRKGFTVRLRFFKEGFSGALNEILKVV